jgi:hypothetical protein
VWLLVTGRALSTFPKLANRRMSGLNEEGMGAGKETGYLSIPSVFNVQEHFFGQ